MTAGRRVTVTGILHPGVMGASLAAACTTPTLWCSAGRSPATRARAEVAGMTETTTLGDLTRRCDLIVSVCPPADAVDVADRVAATGFDGIYADANAISPATARDISGRFHRYVDAGIVGPPVRGPGTTRLYVSGAEAEAVAARWAGTELDVRVIDGGAGAASALKMAYATWTKVSSALLLDVRALARAEGVEESLLAEWSISQPGAEQRSHAVARGSAPKAWRFVGEMEQIAASFGAAGLPDGFALAAAEIYRRLADLRDEEGVDLDAVIDRLRP